MTTIRRGAAVVSVPVEVTFGLPGAVLVTGASVGASWSAGRAARARLPRGGDASEAAAGGGELYASE